MQMARVQCRLFELPCRLKEAISACFGAVRLVLVSLCYNEFTNWSTALDAALEPMFWIVDHFARYLGPIMVILVVLLTTMVTSVFYICILPHIYYQTDMFWSLIHLILSHWVLVNILFNYFMAAFTKPGHPPQNLKEVVSICKKCISPKPPRSHHCTVCGTCILKMDHHCPWINNCVGFYNHRYFFQFVCFMWFGTVYVTFAGYDVFKQHFFGNKELIVPAFFFPINMAYNALGTSDNVKKEVYPNASFDHNAIDRKLSAGLEEPPPIKATLEEELFHNAVILQFLLCAGVSIALGLLGTWHARLISMGQTSIEQHINNKERLRLKKKNMIYKNPYDFGIIKNWKLFFGLKRGRSFFRHVLLPSRHDPLGDGLTWETATFTLDQHLGLDLL